jgi:tRNA U34 5-carboxymethylaminomethyl modifying enzyme MnmG/GidA
MGRAPMKNHRESAKSIHIRKLAMIRICRSVERYCGQMNSGLAAVAVVLAATTFLLGAVNLSDEISRDERLGKLPFIEMSTDGPDTGIWSMID